MTNESEKNPTGANPKPDGQYCETVDGVVCDFKAKNGESTILKNSQTRQIKVAEFAVRDCKEKLENFADKHPFKYNEDLNLLCRCEFKTVCKTVNGKERCHKEIGIEPFLGDNGKNKNLNDVVALTPGICSSFAVWPELITKAENSLMDVCQDEILRPQFVFLGMNWSSQWSDVCAGNDRKCAGCSLTSLPKWTNWHGRSILPAPHEINHLDPSLIVKAFKDNPLRGGYMTDFVKGYVDSNSSKVKTFLNGRKQKMEGCEDKPFFIFLGILKNELAELDKTFELDKAEGVDKYLIVFGPALYHMLEDRARVLMKTSLNDLFRESKRTVLWTDCFYSRAARRQDDEIVQGTRTLHFPDGEVRTVEEFASDFVRSVGPAGRVPT